MTIPISSGPREVHRIDADGVGRCEASAQDDDLRSELADLANDATGDDLDCDRKAAMASAVCLGGVAGTLAVTSVGGPGAGLLAALAAGVECGLLVDETIACYVQK
jgi:hypothetical protein